MMKKSEQELADELDVLLTALLTERPLPPSGDIPEADLAANLLETANQTRPSPQFVARLEARLARAAKAAAQQKKALPEPSGWQHLILSLKELFTMKNIQFVFGGIAVLVLIPLFAWVIFNNSKTAEPGVIVNVTEAAPTSTTEGTEEISQELAQLPAFPASGPGMGGGAGGPGYGGGGNPAPEASQVDMAIEKPFYFDVFSQTIFTLNSILPTEPRAANVAQQSTYSISLEEARELANKFGFTGPIYTQYIQPSSDPSIPAPSPFYIVYDGTRTLNVYDMGASLYDSALTYDPARIPSFEQASSVAEAYLQQHGLLDFPYVVQKGYADSEVFFVRLVDDKPVNTPEIYVSVNGDGQIISVQYNVLDDLQTLGRYPLLSAEEAWNIIQTGILSNNLPYSIWPNLENMPQPVWEEPAVGLYQYWTRTYQPGEEIHLYTWPNVYLPAEDSNLPPRIEVYAPKLSFPTDPAKVYEPKLLLLTGNTADLVAASQIPEHSGYHIWGTIGADGETIELAGWEPIDGYFMPFSGNVQRLEDGTVTLLTAEETYILLNVPADIPDGLRVIVNGQSRQDTGLAYPILEWTQIDKEVDPSEVPTESPIIQEPTVYQPYIYQQISFTTVELVYYQTYIFPETEQLYYTSPPTVLQPAWKFTGTAENGDKIEVFVQAVSPEYVGNSQ